MSDAKTRARGRPRNFDPATALNQARDVFWDAGVSGSSLDDLSNAMQMNRPSIYAAFGDKEALYVRALEGYRDEGADAIRAALDAEKSLAEGLREMYAGALSLYFADTPARGCFLIGTAATESVRNERVRTVFRGSLALYDAMLEERFRLAKKTGEIDSGADPVILAKLADSIMFALAVRARSGESRAECAALAEAGVAMLCGKPSKLRSPKGRKRS